MTMAKRVRFGLSQILKEKGLTQTKFAEMSGLSRQSINRLVNNPSKIYFDSLAKLIDALGEDIELDDLIIVDEQD